MNQVIIMGNLGADAELKYTDGGTGFANLRIATTERRKVKGSDEYEDHTEWHRATLWGKRAEALSKHLTKGAKVLITGSLRTREYEKDGERRWSTDINVNDLEFGGSANGGGGRSEARDEAPPGPNDDDIPF